MNGPEHFADLSDHIAQENYHDPFKAPGRLREFGYHILNHHRATGFQDANPRKAAYERMRWVWRTAIAPILHHIETDIERNVQATLAKEDGLLLSQPGLKTSHLDVIYSKYGSFSGVRLRFLHAAGLISREACVQFWKVRSDEPARLAALKDAYLIQQKEFTAYARPRHIRPRARPASYMSQISVAANTTALALLLPAFHHASLWGSAPSHASDRKQLMFARLDQLARPESLGATAFDKYFPNQKDGLPAASPEECAFNHDEASSEIWQVPSLLRPSSVKNNPMRGSRRCPAAVPLAADNFKPVSAATMRLRSGIYIADQIW